MKQYTGGALRLLLVAGALVLAGCSVSVREPISHEVQLGDTLFSIAFHYGLDWRELAEWNGIGSPYRIYAGQTLTLAPSSRRGKGPVVVDLPTRDPEPVRVARAASPTAEAAPRPVQTSPRPVQTLPRPVQAAPRPVRAKPATLPRPVETSVEKPGPTPIRTSSAPPRSASDWRWPTPGEVVTPFSPTNGKKGIDIRGSAGQVVVAAAAGDVVYSGKGLIGYGNLIIIKHDDTWLSAYGHNRTLLVKEGDQVRAGQEIAQMGQNGKSGSILHFEIRKNGTPVDPARYLPKQ